VCQTKPTEHRSRHRFRTKPCVPTQRWPLFDVAALPCRELENIIPHGVVMMLDSAEGCEWNRIIPRIEGWETVGRKSEKEAFCYSLM
jgi:hypothetical protein